MCVEGGAQACCTSLLHKHEDEALRSAKAMRNGTAETHQSHVVAAHAQDSACRRVLGFDVVRGDK